MPLSETADLVLFHAIRSRSFRALWFMEELGLPYRIEPVDLERNEQKSERLVRHNPMGKVPVVLDGDVAVAESGAIFIYLADKYAPGRLAPRPEDERNRADFLRWMFFAAGVIEPAFAQKFFKWEVPSRQVAWGSFEQMFDVLSQAVSAREWLAGRFSAADIYVASALRYGQFAGIIPKEGPLADYIGRWSARPASQNATEIDKRLMAEPGG